MSSVTAWPISNEMSTDQVVCSGGAEHIHNGAADHDSVDL